MLADFNEKNPEVKVSYPTYFRRVQSKNISFVKLGEELCETCTMLSKSSHSPNCPENCERCVSTSTHTQLAREARESYRKDGEAVAVDTIIRSVDLQKVVMLPRMPGYKSVCFTRRLVAFHHTFSPVGCYRRGNRTNSVIWHEGIMGRKCEDIASAVKLALKEDRDKKEVVYWMDNCAGQNKNYALFTALLELVNGLDISADTITLKYLEAGHTFMSADTVHAQVERQLKKKVNVYDFNDFKSCILETKAHVIEPRCSDFFDMKGHESRSKITSQHTLLCDMRVIQFRRGDLNVHYKKKHNDADFQSFDYLQKKYKRDRPQPLPKGKDRGIDALKKTDVINKLGKLMPDNRIGFWQSLSENDQQDSNDQ